MEKIKRTWKTGSPEKTERNRVMYRRWKKGEGIRPLANEFNIKPSTAHAILHRMNEKDQLKQKAVSR